MSLLAKTATACAGALLLACAAGCGRLSLGDHPPNGTGGGGGGGSGGEPEPPPPALASQIPLGLTSVVAGASSMRVDWRKPAAGLAPPELALLLAASGLPLFDAHPIRLDPQAGHVVIEGLAANTSFALTLALAPEPGAPFAPVGATLHARTAAPIYVDASTPTPGDGSSPAAPLPDLLLAMLNAFAQGGGNVWVVTGEYAGLGLPLFGGVHACGGFAPGFKLEDRDAFEHPTRLTGIENLPIASIAQGGEPAVLDGFELDGLDLASTGVEIEGAPFEGRALTAHACNRGWKIRNAPGQDTFAVSLIACTARGNDIEGLSLEGSLDLTLDGCDFLDNHQEGAAFGGWVAPPGESVDFSARACSFSRNGAEGLDMQLDAPEGGGPSGGRFRVRITSCDFQQNALDGLLVDIDYEAFPAWSADIIVRGTLTRANGGAGIHFDLDSTASAIVHRVQSSANAKDGVLVTSESAGGMTVLSACALLGNQRAGARADLGNFGLLASHTVVSGNGTAGFESPVAPGSAASCVAYLQPAAFGPLTPRGSVVQDLALPAPFLRAPDEYALATGFDGMLLALAAPPLAAPGAIAELSDDGVPRAVVSVAGTLLGIDPLPELPHLPLPVAFFSPGDSVAEDLRLSSDSIALGAGMAPPAGPPIDAGIFSSPAGGPPGTEDPLPAALFFLARSEPPWSLPIPIDAELALELSGGAPDPASLSAGLVLRDAQGALVPIQALVDGLRIHVLPPGGGWQSGMLLELHGALTSDDGRPLSAPVAIPIRTL